MVTYRVDFSTSKKDYERPKWKISVGRFRCYSTSRKGGVFYQDVESEEPCERFDSLKIAIIGSGIYGLHAARTVARSGHEVDVFEKEAEGMSGASLVNQARVHGGYHYPRSISTAARSQRNYQKFVNDFSLHIKNDFKSIYGIAVESKVSPQKFWQLSKMIDASIKIASKKESDLFNRRLISEIFEVIEYAFDSRGILAQLLNNMPTSVKIFNNTQILSFRTSNENGEIDSKVYLDGEHKTFGPYDFCINATYGELDQNQYNSSGLLFEVCELMQVRVPEELKDLAITIMDGPFFSITPWPAFEGHVLSHVRFTPHVRFSTFRDAQIYISNNQPESRFELAARDCKRYLPVSQYLMHLESKYAVKTILPSRDYDDARPILAESRNRILNLIGSKIDNIYDIDGILLTNLERIKHQKSNIY